MDPVAISIAAVILSPVLGVLSVVIGGAYNRRSSKETNDIGRFEAFMQAAETRIKRLESQVADLERSKSELSLEISHLTEDNKRLSRANFAQNRYIQKLLDFISRNLPDIERHHYDPDVTDALLIADMGVLRPYPTDEGV